MLTQAIGVKKASISMLNTLVLGALAGVYIGFGAALATLVAHDAGNAFGLGMSKVLTGSVFSVGLILVVIAGTIGLMAVGLYYPIFNMAKTMQ